MDIGTLLMSLYESTSIEIVGTLLSFPCANASP